jgi:hypothetical protein
VDPFPPARYAWTSNRETPPATRYPSTPTTEVDPDPGDASPDEVQVFPDEPDEVGVHRDEGSVVPDPGDVHLDEVTLHVDHGRHALVRGHLALDDATATKASSL